MICYSDFVHVHADSQDYSVCLVFPNGILGSLRCYDGPNKIIQINSSEENLPFIINRVSNTISNRKGMRI